MDVTLENSHIKDQIRHLQQTYEASMDKLREKQRQLEAAQMENQLLKMRVRLPAFPTGLSLLSPVLHLSFPILFLTRVSYRHGLKVPRSCLFTVPCLELGVPF